MPLYRIHIQEGSLSAEEKAALAAEITAFHCDLTGLEPAYVKVLFDTYPPGDGYVAGAAGPAVVLTVLIRAGRSTDYKQKMLQHLWMMLQGTMGLTNAQLLVAIEEAPGSQAMEMGLIMPEVAS